MQQIKKLIKTLKNRERIFIQTHNFPDHDAVASAFGLQYLLRSCKIESTIIYHGEILRDSLKKMINRLKIEILPHYKYKLNENDTIIIVDANKKNRNVAALKGNVAAVIDHHPGESYDDLDFCDIRSDYGACSTIIFSYFAELQLEPSAEVATALHIGICFDTHQFSRNVNPLDIETTALLYRVSDSELVSSLVRNSITIEDFKYYRFLLDNVRIEKDFAFCHFNNGCNKDLLAILADYLLSAKEIKFALLSTKLSGEIAFCARSEMPELPANTAIQKLLSGIGSGGGHLDMAGGRISDPKDFNPETIFKAALSLTKNKDKFIS